MKQLKRFLTLSITASMLAGGFASCSDNDDDKLPETPRALAFQFNESENALRYPVDITFSADCQAQIRYWEKGRPETVRITDPVATQGGKATVMVKFVKGRTEYDFEILANGTPQEQPLSFRTNDVPPQVPIYNVTVDNEGAPTKGYVLQWQATKPGYITFCDMDGNVVWYEEFDQAIRMAHYDSIQQRMCVLTGFRDGVNSKNFQRLCDKIITLDLDGNREVEWVASDENVPYPHHDIKYTPSGDLIMVCNTKKEFDLSSFGLGVNDTVWGDGFTIINQTTLKKESWNNFGELTPFNSNDVILERGAVKDFLHANSVNWDSNGDYYMTFNRINELWKINGKTGDVIYRVGPNGNVELDPEGYACGLHAAEPLAPNKVLCFDNGSDKGQSRAIIYEIDPAAKSAKVTLSVPIPKEYSSTDRSNVQLISDGKQLFFGSTLGRAGIFTDLEGNILKVITRTGISYRAYYYPDL